MNCEFIPRAECTNASAGCWYAGKCLHKCDKAKARLTDSEFEQVGIELKQTLNFVQSSPESKAKVETIRTLINLKQKLGIYE